MILLVSIGIPPKNMAINRLNVRVYGLLLRHPGLILVSDEYRFGKFMTKFPGGGLIPGEGPEECLIREWQEELGLEITIQSLVFTPGKLIQSAFAESDQVLPLYYMISVIGLTRIRVSEREFDFPVLVDGAQTFRWAELSALTPTFPGDREAVNFLRNQMQFH